MSNAWWTVVSIVAAVGMAACLYLMYGSKWGVKPLKAIDEGYQSIDMRFHYGHKQVFETLDALGESGRPCQMRLWLIDFVFIVFFGLVMLVVTRNTAQMAWLKQVMVILTICRAGLDVVENLLLMAVCASLPKKRHAALADVAGFVTSAKFVALIAWIVALFVGLVFTAAKY